MNTSIRPWPVFATRRIPLQFNRVICFLAAVLTLLTAWLAAGEEFYFNTDDGSVWRGLPTGWGTNQVTTLHGIEISPGPIAQGTRVYYVRGDLILRSGGNGESATTDHLYAIGTNALHLVVANNVSIDSGCQVDLSARNMPGYGLRPSAGGGWGG